MKFLIIVLSTISIGVSAQSSNPDWLKINDGRDYVRFDKIVMVTFFTDRAQIDVLKPTARKETLKPAAILRLQSMISGAPNDWISVSISGAHNAFIRISMIASIKYIGGSGTSVQSAILETEQHGPVGEVTNSSGISALQAITSNTTQWIKLSNLNRGHFTKLSMIHHVVIHSSTRAHVFTSRNNTIFVNDSTILSSLLSKID